MDNSDTFCTECISEICKIFDLYLDSAEYFKRPFDQGPVQEFKKEIKEESLREAEQEKMRCIIENDLKQFKEECECPEPQKTQFSLEEMRVEIEKAVDELKTMKEKECVDKIKDQTEKLTSRFDLILSNEQTRTTLRLQDMKLKYSKKMSALRNHLECKNMTNLMYVLANERRTCKLEMAKLIDGFEDREAELLKDINNQNQLLDSMMKEHRLATMVNAEWQDKMMKVLCAFYKFIAYAFDRTPDSVQCFLDIPAMMECDALKEPVLDEKDVKELPEKDSPSTENEGLKKICSTCMAECGCKDLTESPSENWWKMLESEAKPFIVYGDLSTMPPTQRRHILRTLPENDEAKLDTCVFNDRVLKADCCNKQIAQEYYNSHLEPCQPPRVSICSFGTISCAPEYEDTPDIEDSKLDKKAALKKENNNGIDLMRSTHPRIESEVFSIASERPAPGILAAMDSFEIVSSTKLLTKGKAKKKSILINKRQSIKLDVKRSVEAEEIKTQIKIPTSPPDPCGRLYSNSESSSNEIFKDIRKSRIGEVHHDSLPLIAETKIEPVRDKIIEMTCPENECLRLRIGSYFSNLPSYMWPTKLNYNEDVDFENYKPCTQSQIDKLLAHTEKHHAHLEYDLDEMDMEEMSTEDSLLNIGTRQEYASNFQTNGEGIAICECDTEHRNIVRGKICGGTESKKYKDMLDEIPEPKLWSKDVEMKRMHVLGSEDRNMDLSVGNDEFMMNRVNSIKKILADHPSMCTLFQGSTKCI